MLHLVYLAFVRVSAVVAKGTFFKDALCRTAEMSELPNKYDLLAAQLSSVTSECGRWRSSAQERINDTINFRAFVDTSKNKVKLLEGQDVAVSEKKQAITFEQDAYAAKRNGLQALMCCYQDACIHLVKRLDDEGVG